jgi:hypothetical protein
MARESLNRRLAPVAKDSQVIPAAKVAHDMEVDATARYRESLKKKYGRLGG